MGRRRNESTAVKPFGGIDGESYTIDGEHRYVLLMDSQGEYIFQEEGLSTKACFDFLLSRDRNRIWTAFGLNYDVNMILRDVGDKKLRELWRTGETRWFNYLLEWIPGKWFQVTDLSSIGAYRTKGGNTKAGYAKQVKINEVFGFFQTSFIKSLEKWNITTQDSDMLESMKASRSIFDPAMKEQIIDYCHTECVLLTRLMEAVRNALESVNIKCTSWNGAGSVAAAIFKREQVKGHLVTHEEYQDEILRAYFGGRTELYRLGPIGECIQYDIVSAYPYAATYLPTLQGQFQEVRSEDLESESFGLVHVTWDVDSLVPPFPSRTKSRISYPTKGEGWYHVCEVQAAKAIFGDAITVHKVLAFHPDTDERPFQFVEELALQKVKYKREKHAGEKVLKLGINSLYGKLAQGKGYKGTLPPYQSYFWAGAITAHCRARMLTLAHKAGTDNVVMLATDGIFLRKDPEWESADTLGSLEKGTLYDMFTVQPGVYNATDESGREVRKSRGFFAKEIDFDQIRKGYSEEGPFFVGRYDSTRFVGLGSALSSAKRLDEQWRTWQTSERKLVLYPSTRYIVDFETEPITLVPVTPMNYTMSEPYSPKGGYEDDESNYRDGKDQPLRGDI